MTIPEAGKNLLTELSNIYDYREAENITDLIIEKISGLTKTQRLINKKIALTKTQQAQLKDFTNQLLQHKPVQYVLNEAWFCGMKFYVDEHVLIPRPETEELVDCIISDLQLTIRDSRFTILDIGTGSGCIAISLKKKLPATKVYALETSEEALIIAKQNAVLNNADIEFIHADILKISSANTFPLFDIIVSNPPYIKQNEAATMASNVLLYEPKSALFVPDNNPLLFYSAIADFSLQNLKPGKGKLYFEIHEAMGIQVAALLNEKGFTEIHVKKDMQGKDRIVRALLR